MPGAIATMAMAEGGTLLNAPDVYMDKIAIGPGYPKGVVDLDAPADENIRALAKAKGVKPEDITALILDRPRHADMIAAVRKTGAAVRLITDGDVAGVIHTADPDKTGIDIYLGIGGAPEGVLAAAALRCIGGQMQCRLVLDTDEKRERAAKMGIKDPRKKYRDRGHGARRLPVRRDRRHRRLACCKGVQIRQRHRRDRDRGDALGHRHGALDPGRAPAAGEVLGLRLFHCRLQVKGGALPQQLNLDRCVFFWLPRPLGQGSQSCVARWSLARSIASVIKRLASSASPQPPKVTHFPSSRSL